MKKGCSPSPRGTPNASPTQQLYREWRPTPIVRIVQYSAPAPVSSLFAKKKKWQIVLATESTEGAPEPHGLDTGWDDFAG